MIEGSDGSDGDIGIAPAADRDARTTEDPADTVTSSDTDLPAAASGSGPAEVPGRAESGAAAGTMTITFKLYATLQDLLPAGAVRNAIPIEIAADASLNDVIDRHRVPRALAHLVLVNGVFVCDADRDARGTLRPDDVLAIWPPVAGG